MQATVNSTTAISKEEGWLKEVVNQMMADLMRQQGEELRKFVELEAEEETKAAQNSAMLKDSA
jgi:hypothetical protein